MLFRSALSLWLPRLPQMLSVPFAMPHWAFSFPLSALASATLAYAERAASPMLWQLGHLLLTVVAGLTAWLTVRTLQVWRAGTFARPEA